MCCGPGPAKGGTRRSPTAPPRPPSRSGNQIGDGGLSALAQALSGLTALQALGLECIAPPFEPHQIAQAAALSQR